MIKTINMEKYRLERTVIEVSFEDVSETYVLKCIKNTTKQSENHDQDEKTQTVAQSEVAAFDSIPDELKHVFVQKHAHGRLLFQNASFEVILLEKMFPVNLNTALTLDKAVREPNTAYEWLAHAFGLLHKMHSAGYAHGDSNCQNFLWTTGIGEGTMKLIDLERTRNLKSISSDGSPMFDNVSKAICKLNDISTLLLKHSLADARRRDARGRLHILIDYEDLHRRLKLIKSHLPGPQYINSRVGVFLDDLLPCNDLITDCCIDTRRLRNAVEYLQQTNTSQFEKMMEPQFDENLNEFTSELSNPSFLKRVFEYMIKQLRKIDIEDETIDEYDEDIPNYTDSLQHREEKPDPFKDKNAFPLKLDGKEIFIREESDTEFESYQIYYSIDENDEVSLLAYDGQEVYDYDGARIRMIFTKNSPLTSEGEDLYFSFNTMTATLIIYKQTPRNIWRRVQFHQFHNTPMQPHS
jgi:hypothetical protein